MPRTDEKVRQCWYCRDLKGLCGFDQDPESLNCSPLGCFGISSRITAISENTTRGFMVNCTRSFLLGN